MTESVVRIVLVHQSVGRQLLVDGDVRGRLRAILPEDVRAELWSHDFNRRGLTGPDGASVGRRLPVPDDDTDPGGLLRIFTSHDDAARRTRRQLLEFDVIATKSSFVNSAIRSDAQLSELADRYRSLIAAWRELSPTRFLLITTPPLVPSRTDPAQARRAQRLSRWLAAGGGGAVGNVSVFDLFSRLAALHGPHAGMLTPGYRRLIPIDAHPNARAAQDVAGPLARALASVAADRIRDADRVASEVTRSPTAR